MTEKEQKERAAAVKGMIETRGWQILEEELTVESNSLNANLIDEDDAEKMISLQRDLRAIKKLLGKIVSYSQIKT